MFKIKRYFEILNNGVIITNKVWVENSILNIISNGHYKCENGKWYIKTPLTSNDFIFLGVGALPSVQIEKTGVENEISFDALFEKISETNIN
jgi:hypothetical protein